MKTITSIILFFVAISFASAQTEFEKAMQKGLQAMDSSKTDQQMKDIAAKFERIANAEPEQWLPRYYSSLIYVILAYKTDDLTAKQTDIDYAQKQLDEAMKISAKESELYTLQGMIYQATIMLDPMKNGQVYGSKSAGSFQEALRLNPSNSRPVYLQATTILYTPEQYGGGKKTAYPMFEKALGLFNAFVPAGEFYPKWGREDCQKNLEMCKEN
jgi:hypothetical protein